MLLITSSCKAAVKVLSINSLMKKLNIAVTTEIRNQSSQTDIANDKSEEWSKAVPYNCIPGPQSLPVIGNTWRFLPHIGDFHGLNLFDIHKKLHETHGKIAVLKDIFLIEDLVVLFTPEDIELMHRNEGAYPVRNILKSFEYYRAKVRPDVFQGETSLLSSEGSKWFNFRTKINPILLQPRIILQYVEGIDFITNDFIQQIRRLSKCDPQGEMPEDFIIHIYSWTLESVAFVALDRRMGCLDPNLEEDSEPKVLINSLLKAFYLFYIFDFIPSLSNIFQQYSMLWKEYIQVQDNVTFTFLKYIEEARQKAVGQNANNSQLSMLQLLLKVNRKIALAMSIDLLMAGTDTTGKVAGAGLYYLAKTPRVQDKLRQEMRALLPSKDAPITKKVLSDASYLKTVVKEVLRLAPIGVGNYRKTTTDMVFQGYQVPKGTPINASNLILCHSDKHFPRARELIPERWLRSNTGEMSHKNTHPFVYLPFGFGPRSCIGQRLATLELEILFAKIIRNFVLEWHHGEMTYKTTPFYGIASPLKLRFKEIKDN